MNTDKITPAELRSEFESLHNEIAELHAAIESIRGGLQQASQPAPSAALYQDFESAEIIMSTGDKGEPVYKIKGAPFLKFGVRVWPETLPALNIDPATLKPGPNPLNRRVRALMKAGENEQPTPQKIIGLAPQ